jgi:hypothetical protein
MPKDHFKRKKHQKSFKVIYLEMTVVVKLLQHTKFKKLMPLIVENKK